MAQSANFDPYLVLDDPYLTPEKPDPYLSLAPARKIAGQEVRTPMEGFKALVGGFSKYAGKEAGKVEDWAINPPPAVQGILARSDQAAMDAPSGSVEEKAARGGQFLGHFVAPMTAPLSVAAFGTGPGVAATAKVAPKLVPAAEVVAGLTNLALTAPMAKAAGEFAGEASVSPNAANIGAVLGTTAMAALGAAGTAASYRGIQAARQLESKAANEAAMFTEAQNSYAENVRVSAAKTAQQAEVEKIIRATDFDKAQAELIQQRISEQQAGGAQENIVLETPTAAKEIRLDVAGEPAVKERARIDAERKAQIPVVDEGKIPARVQLSPQASKMLSSEGWGMGSNEAAINVDLLSKLAQMGGTSGLGFAWGWHQGKDLPPEERAANAVMWGTFGGLLASPLRGAAVNAIRSVHIPVGKGALSNQLAGAENFYLFQKSTLGGVYDALRMKEPEIAALALNPLRHLTSLEKQMANATVGDKVSVNNYLQGQGSSGNIIDLNLKKAAELTRSSVDDLTDNFIATGIVKPGSDLQNTLIANKGEYLRRSYELFENPKFKPDPKKISVFVNEYVRNELLNGVTKPIVDLRQEGFATAMRYLSKGTGGAVDAATRFASDGSIVGANGGVLMHRKELSDSLRSMMGEINDPVKLAGLTIDRMAHYIAAVKTQQKMREVGLQAGIFSEKATPEFSRPMVEGGKDVAPNPLTGVVDRAEIGSHLTSKGPLSDLWTRPEVADALRSYEAYQGGGLMWRTLATATAYSKISKTVQNIVSYAPNFWSSWATMLGQGSGVHLVAHPKAIGPAIRVIFDDVLPSSNPAIQRDAEFLTREGLLRQNVNLNDVVGHIRDSFVPTIGGKVSMVLPNALVKGAKATSAATKNAYGKMEELPRILGFYLEVERYKWVFPNMPLNEVYSRAAKVTRDVYPNASQIPELIQKASVAGVTTPFISWQYETFWRNPYNTIRTAHQDIVEGLATKNPRQVAEGALRMSSFVGAVGGAIAINEALKERSGVGPKQEEAIKRLVPEYDKDGLLLIAELTPDSVAYANQSYVMPHSLPASAIKAALSGVSPAEAAMLGAQQVLGALDVGGGGTIIRPAVEAVITGRNKFGRELFTQDAGKFVDVTGMERWKQDSAIKGQQFLERATYFGKEAFLPGSINEATKWKKSVYGEVGPDGQVYQMGDLVKRLGGVRITRLNLPVQFERSAKGIGGRLQTVHEQFARVRDKVDSTPENIETAYQLQEAARKRIYGDVQTYLTDAIELSQPRDKMIENLKKGGIPSEMIIGALNNYYVVGRKEKGPTIQERVDQIMALPQAKQDAAWAAFVKDDPIMARSVRSQFKANVKENALKITEEDKLLENLPIPDGTRAKNVARIIVSKAGTDMNAAKKILDEFKAKRIVVPAVDFQLRDPALWAEVRAQLKPQPKSPP